MKRAVNDQKFGRRFRSGKEAPLRLVFIDRDPDRSIYGIAGLTLVDGIKLANQLPSVK
jgi:hypothetical protein